MGSEDITCTSIDEAMKSTYKDGAVWVKPWRGTADRIGVRDCPRNDLDFLIPHTTTRDLKVILSSIHRVMGTVEK